MKNSDAKVMSDKLLDVYHEYLRDNELGVSSLMDLLEVSYMLAKESMKTRGRKDEKEG